jgi:hypothetical protein
MLVTRAQCDNVSFASKQMKVHVPWIIVTTKISLISFFPILTSFTYNVNINKCEEILAHREFNFRNTILQYAQDYSKLSVFFLEMNSWKIAILLL